MRLHPQNRASKGCGSAHSQAHVSADATNFFPTSSSEYNASVKQSGLNIQPPTLPPCPPCPTCPPCYTQLTVVTCCCFFKQCVICEERKPLSLPSPTSCGLDDTSQPQQPHRGFDCPVPHLAPSPTGEIVLPSWSSGLHICLDTGACKPRCCTRSHLGKRIFRAARRTLARFGLTRRRSVHFQSTSPKITEHRGQSPTEHFLTHDSIPKPELQGHLRLEADSGMSWELDTREIEHAPQELPAEPVSEEYVPHEPVSILESGVPTVDMSPHFAPPGFLRYVDDLCCRHRGPRRTIFFPMITVQDRRASHDTRRARRSTRILKSQGMKRIMQTTFGLSLVAWNRDLP